MAPFTISPHRSLFYQCHLPQTAPYQQSKMSSELSSNTTGTPEDLPLSAYRRMSVSSMLLKIRLHLWQVIQRVQNCFMSVIELFSSNMFLFICVGKKTAMTGELNSVVEAQERPGVEFMSGMLRSVELDKEIKDSEMELDDEGLTTPADRQEWSMDDSEEEEEDEWQLSEWESEEDDDDDDEEEEEEEEEEEDGEDNEEQTTHEETECDVDSEWSDDDDDDDDSEASTESLELWESFFKSSDPYNPLSFSSCTASRTNTASTNKVQLTPSSEIKQATNEEEHYPKPSTKKGQKVRFNDKVTVRPLVAWSFAGRAARDGSCWMRMARDRERFRRRVESVENIITPCLTSAHRAGVWERLQRKTSL